MHVGSNVRNFVDLYLSEAGGSFNEGYAHWEAVTIGGTTKKGYDATNEFNLYLIKVQTRISAKLSRPCGKDPYGKPEEISL